MPLTVVRVGRPLRCAACHEAAAELADCARCGTALHAGCLTELGGCPTLGCRSPRSVVVVPRTLSPTDWPFLILIAWLVLFPCASLLQLCVHGLASEPYPCIERAGLARLLLWPTDRLGLAGCLLVGAAVMFGSPFLPRRRGAALFGLLSAAAVVWSVLLLPYFLHGLGVLCQG